MKRMKKAVAACLSAVLLAGLMAGCSTQEGMTKVRLCEVTHSIFYAPQYVAINEGFFAEEGIEIELSNGQGADKVMAAVLADQIDIGFAGPEAAIYVYNEGKEDFAQPFAQLTQRDGSFLVGRAEEPDFDWSSLKGRTLLPGRKGGVPYMTLEYVVKQKGLVPGEDVIFDDSIQFALMAGAFTGGTADYVTLFEPTASMMELEGKGYIVASVGAEAGEIPYTAYFAKKSYIEKNSDLVQRFVNAIYRGQQWVASHTAAEIAQVLAPSFPDTEASLIELVVENYKQLGVWNATPYMSEESFELLQTVMAEAGELDEKAPYQEVVNNSFAEQAMEQ